jgi:hypothetical protein
VASALIPFSAAHLALTIGLTTPDKITFDEVHASLRIAMRDFLAIVAERQK